MTNLDSASFLSGNLSPPQRIVILVPQGQEHQAILRGLKDMGRGLVQVVAIPLGIRAVTEFLGHWQPPPDREGILVMGLAGALSESLQIGQVVVYESCRLGDHVYQTDLAWSQSLSQDLVALRVHAYTSQSLVTTAQAKTDLHHHTSAEVVDMEGGPILDYGARLNLPVAMVRVISDVAQQDLPDLSGAIGADGSLNSGLLAWAFLQKPIAAGHLIAGSLRGLARLSEITKKLFQT